MKAYIARAREAAYQALPPGPVPPWFTELEKALKQAEIRELALEKIWQSGHPDAAHRMPDLRWITEAEFGDRLVRIAGEALGYL